MYIFAVLFSFIFCFRVTISVTNTGQYVVVPQHMLLGWSQKLENIDQVQCLLACSRKVYCFSVNYNRKDEVCQISKQIRDEATGDFLTNSSYDYMEKVINKDFKEHGVYFMEGKDNYEDAVESCSNHLGFMASYEQLHNAFHPNLENCKEGWLISGEIAFTEITNSCTLRPPEQRSNVFPCKTYQSGVYCHKKYNTLADTFDYLPKTQRIIRLTDSNSKKLNAEDAEICCSIEFSGVLATPVDVYNSQSLGADLCVYGWLADKLAGNPCKGHEPPDFWLFPAGNHIQFEALTNEYQALCFVSLANQTLSYIDPFPSHRVIHGMEERYSLNYYDADAFCRSRGGRMATEAEVQYAWRSGYDRCSLGWVESGQIIIPIVKPRSNCGSFGVRISGVKDKNHTHMDVFCYMP